MLDKVKYTTLRDICITDLIFYENQNEQELVDFCKTNAISYVPSNDRCSCYKFTQNGFTHVKPLPEELICHPHDRIFDEETIMKFRSGNHDEVMFLVEEGLIKGVVHIIDYNNDDLYVELYRMLLKFESRIRKILCNRNLSDDDMVNWFLKKAQNSKGNKDKEYYNSRYQTLISEKEVSKRKNTNPFQTFYLRDLLSLAISRNIIDKKHFDINKISNVRNWIAHSKDVTSIHPKSDHPVYNIDGLINFIEMTRSFFKSYEALEMLLE